MAVLRVVLSDMVVWYVDHGQKRWVSMEVGNIPWSPYVILNLPSFLLSLPSSSPFRPYSVNPFKEGIGGDLFHTYCDVELFPLNHLQSSSIPSESNKELPMAATVVIETHRTRAHPPRPREGSKRRWQPLSRACDDCANWIFENAMGKVGFSSWSLLK